MPVPANVRRASRAVHCAARAPWARRTVRRVRIQASTRHCGPHTDSARTGSVRATEDARGMAVTAASERYGFGSGVNHMTQTDCVMSGHTVLPPRPEHPAENIGSDLQEFGYRPCVPRTVRTIPFPCRQSPADRGCDPARIRRAGLYRYLARSLHARRSRRRRVVVCHVAGKRPQARVSILIFSGSFPYRISLGDAELAHGVITTRNSCPHPEAYRRRGPLGGKSPTGVAESVPARGTAGRAPPRSVARQPSWPGGRRQLPTRGSHRSGHVQFERVATA